MRFHFIPNFSGDFRLEQGDDKHCILTVEKPSAGDRALLQPFLIDARKRGWICEEDGIGETSTQIRVGAPITDASPVLAKLVTDDAKVWTAIRYTSGKVELVDGNTWTEKLADGAKKTAASAVEAVATITEPARGCPEPEPRNRRASVVLQAFCTESQWRSFERNGYLNAIGNTTGRMYRVWHEDEAAKRGHQRSLTVASTGEPVCAWNEAIPAEEQALSLKLAVEHREAWLLSIKDGHGGVTLAHPGDIRRFA